MILGLIQLLLLSFASSSFSFHFLYILSLGLSFSVICIPVLNGMSAFGADFFRRSTAFIIPIVSFFFLAMVYLYKLRFVEIIITGNAHYGKQKRDSDCIKIRVLLVRVTGFACISFSLAGDAKKKERNSPVFALAHAHAAGMCGHDSNPVTEKGKHPPCGGVSLFGPSDRIRTCGIVVPNHARYQLRYTRKSSEETRSVPFPPGGENCTCAPSFFLSKSDPLRWAPIR